MARQKTHKIKMMEEQLAKKLNRQVVGSLVGCVHCGMCDESCHYVLAFPDDHKMTPSYKADQVRKLFKANHDWTGSVFPWWVGADKVPLTDDDLRRAVAVMNDERSLRRQLALTMKRPDPPWTGRQLLDFKNIISGIEEDREEYPTLSERDNIIIIADEAHRSQYGFKAKILTKEDKALLTYGFAKYIRDALPNASFIGFTGTPIEKDDKSTPAVFGKYVDIYDIKNAVEDGATVRIYYESRLAKLEIKPEERPKIDEEFEEITEGEETSRKEMVPTFLTLFITYNLVLDAQFTMFRHKILYPFHSAKVLGHQ